MSLAAILLLTAPLVGLVIGQRRRYRALALTIIFGSAIAGVCYGYWWLIYAGAVRIPFDSEAWKASLLREDHTPIRLEMVDSLLEQNHLQGMSRDEVFSLIGKTPETPYFNKYDLVYWLGPERGNFRI